MKVQKLMELPEKYIDAYNYYKRVQSQGTQDEGESHGLLVSRVARMFMLPNIKDFYLYVLKRDKMEAQGYSS